MRFRVGEREFELAVSAAELQSYRAFQRAALERANVMVRHGDERTSARLATWPRDVDLAIARGAREG
ncbi:MAG: hypothetical protein D6760_04855 [Deltaproteobacteria bacterium]|nr:MAG: hypothetical protein D6760_04855 [Deltaproteobacteria bacterium]